MAKQTFGGDWTTDKLERVSRYLKEYTKIFDKNPRAQTLKTIYVDAFAGSGYISNPPDTSDTTYISSFPELAEPETVAFFKGSARIALEVEPSFDGYLFIEQDAEYAQELHKLKEAFPSKAAKIKIVKSDANTYLAQWCATVDWKRTRAVVFLDPYGMQVEWSLIQSIANTKSIDLWILFPAGAVNRLLTREKPPPKEWGQALTRLFGTNEWEKKFYSKQKQQTLFGEEESQHKDANFDKIARFFIERLNTVFAKVAKKWLWLENSNHVPLFLLCFAASNPKGAPTAVKIAEYILEREPWRPTRK